MKHAIVAALLCVAGNAFAGNASEPPLAACQVKSAVTLNETVQNGNAGRQRCNEIQQAIGVNANECQVKNVVVNGQRQIQVQLRRNRTVNVNNVGDVANAVQALVDDVLNNNIVGALNNALAVEITTAGKCQ
jgi:hypothetical protein